MQLRALRLLPFLAGTLALKINRVSFLQRQGGETPTPIPGDVLFMEMRSEVGDPNMVDVNLYNIDRKNETVGLTSLDPIRNSRVGFEVPSVPEGNFWIRILSSQSRNILVQSTTFQIYAIHGTQIPISMAQAITAASTTDVFPATMTTVSVPTTSESVVLPSAAAAGSASPSTTSINPGIIAGATIGGILLVLLIMGLLYLSHRRRTPEGLEVAPFSISQPAFRGITPVPLPSPPPKTDMALSAAQAAASRAQTLVRERERLDREIATLEGSNRSLTRNTVRPGIPSRENTDRDVDNGVRSQLEILQEQVRRLEVTVEAPPGYQ